MPAARARATQAEIARAIRAARAEGCAAVEVFGAIRIYLDAAPAGPLPSSDRDGEEAACDEAFGTGS
ncbi:hypothetical protein [Jannaschia formosa]|uniref:hypothetical protein n=1 Tax=Jannaschia formosa TaxID=2259592 RepID=UPI000E1B8FB4|nr:hypothetical protein [Jannaschia formosa]TFL16396.1 hypothetical protein DR046_19940 [Jannaschia formosa]